MITLYLFAVLGKIGESMLILSILSGISVFGLSIWFGIELSDSWHSDKEKNEENKTIVKKWNMRFIKIILACLILNIFIPSLKETAFIYIVGKISQNENIQEIPDKALTILNLKLDEYLKDFDSIKKEK